MLIPGAIARPASALAGADEPIVRDHRGPIARIEVVVKKIRVLNDRDWGSGEMLFQMGLYCLPRTVACDGQADSTLGGFRKEFSAVDGQIVALDQVLPLPGSGNPSDEASVYMGYPLYRGQEYELVFSMWEQDGIASGDEYMGRQVIRLTQENAFGIGTHTNLRSVRDGGTTPGDYELQLEIRRAPVPDLRATGIKIHDLPGSTRKLVCMGVSNAGLADAGPFAVRLTVDGGEAADAAVAGLVAGRENEVRVDDLRLKKGKRALVATVDATGAVAESGEDNNERTATAECKDDDEHGPGR